MANALPAEIRQVALLSGSAYRLPIRGKGAGALAGLGAIAFGCVFSGFALFWMWGASRSIWDSDGAFQIFGIFFTAFGIPFFLVGLMPIGIGLTLLFGRTEVQVQSGELRAIERIGPFRWTRSRPISDIRRIELRLKDKKTFSARQSSRALEIGEATKLRAVCEDNTEFNITGGYPAELLRPLAEELARECEAEHGGHLVCDERIEARVTVVDDDGDADADANAPESPVYKPQRSRTTIDRRDDGLTIDVPPAGLIRGSKGMFFFAMIWCGMISLFTVLMFFGEPSDPNQSPWAMLFLLPFWAVGVGMMLAAINMGRRRAIFDVVGQGESSYLLITRRSLFGTKQLEWASSDIEALFVGPSGMEVNDSPVNNLRIKPRSGKEKGFLTQLKDDELEWIAYELRTATGIGR